MMIDINRCLISTTSGPMQRLNDHSNFSKMLTNLCLIVPVQFEDRISIGARKIKEVDNYVKSKIDSGLGIE